MQVYFAENSRLAFVSAKKFRIFFLLGTRSPKNEYPKLKLLALLRSQHANRASALETDAIRQTTRSAT